MCKGCHTLVANPVVCVTCGISAHPSCVSRTGHPHKDLNFVSCSQPLASTSDEQNEPLSFLRDIQDTIESQFNRLRTELRGWYTAEFKEINDTIRQLSDRMKTLENKLSSRLTNDQDEEDIIAEIHDRERRSKNLIFYNLEEENPSDTSTSPSDDMHSLPDTVNQIIKIIHPLASPCLKARRLGRRISGKTRPVCVVLPSKSDVINILKNKQKYTGPVAIKNDMTLKQRSYLSKVRNDLKNLINSGVTDKTIRYINGVPKIVNMTQKN